MVNPQVLYIVALALVMSSSLPRTVPAQGEESPQDLSVAPMRVDLEMSSGAVHTETLGVFNAGDEPVHMRAAAADWFFNENDVPQYVPAGIRPSFSCGSWLSLNPVEFEVPPRQATPIRLTVATPPGQPAGGYHCAVTIAIAPGPEPSPPAAGLRVLVRFATTLYVVIGDPLPQVEVASLEVVPAAPDAPVPPGTGGKPRWQYLLTLHNTGPTHFRVNGTLELLDHEGRSVSNFKIGSQPVLPESQRTFKFTFARELPPGDYHLVVTIDIGLKTLLQAKKKVRIEPPAPPAVPITTFSPIQYWQYASHSSAKALLSSSSNLFTSIWTISPL